MLASYHDENPRLKLLLDPEMNILSLVYTWTYKPWICNCLLKLQSYSERLAKCSYQFGTLCFNQLRIFLFTRTIGQ